MINCNAVVLGLGCTNNGVAVFVFVGLGSWIFVGDSRPAAAFVPRSSCEGSAKCEAESTLYVVDECARAARKRSKRHANGRMAAAKLKFYFLI